MKLLTKEIEARFKKVGSQEEVKNPLVVAKFFDPTGQATWFATEYDPKTKVFFGYVSLFNQAGMNEWGYFSLEELESIRGKFGLGIERDMYCSTQTIKEWKKEMAIV